MKYFPILFFVVISCSTGEKEKVSLSPKEFQDKIASVPNAVILDVRTKDEVRQGYIKGAMNFDFNAPEFNTLMQGMDKTKPYFVYCAAGKRSAKAAERMRDMDFQHVYTLDGGLNAWQADGLPVATPAPAQ